MDFDNIKSALDSDTEGFDIPTTVDQLKASKLPIESIRKTMRSEIISQLVIILIFYAVLFVVDLTPLAFSVYLIFITITCIFTLMYIVRLSGFLKRTSKMALNTKASIYFLITDLKLTLEVYKTAIIAGSILLPIPTMALLMGMREVGNPEYFEQMFLFQGSTIDTILMVVSFFAFVIFSYYLTIWWAEKLYGVHIKHLEGILEELEE